MLYNFIDDCRNPSTMKLFTSIMEAEDAKQEDNKQSDNKQSDNSASTSGNASEENKQDELQHLNVQCPNYNPPSGQFPARKKAPEYIIIHYTAGRTSAPGSAAKAASNMAASNSKSSADFFVDRNTIIQYNPDYHKYYSQAAGQQHNEWDGKIKTSVHKSVHVNNINSKSISIEMCSDWDESVEKFKENAPMSPAYKISPEVATLAAKLCGALMREFNIPADKVVMHNMVAGKLCPAPWCRTEEEVQMFRNFVQMAAGNTEYTVDTTKDEGKSAVQTYDDKIDDMYDDYRFDDDDVSDADKSKFGHKIAQLGVAGIAKAASEVAKVVNIKIKPELKDDFMSVANEMLKVTSGGK